MRHWINAIVLCAAFVCALGTASNAQAPNSPAAAEALAQDYAWAEAYKNRDRNALERILADEFIFTDDEGKLYDKKQYIAAAVDVIRVASYVQDDTTVRVSGDTGVVAGRWAGTLTIDGKDASGVSRFTDTYVRRDGRWQAIAAQNTKLPQAK